MRSPAFITLRIPVFLHMESSLRNGEMMEAYGTNIIDVARDSTENIIRVHHSDRESSTLLKWYKFYSTRENIRANATVWDLSILAFVSIKIINLMMGENYNKLTSLNASSPS